MVKRDEIQEIIDKSGNDLQFQVRDYFRSHKWEASVSPYYNDPATGKSREIDIIATRKWLINDDFRGQRLGELIIRLFIECKHIKDPIVFWFDQKQMQSATNLAKDNDVLHDKPDHYLNPNHTSQHHYIDNVPVAKIWANSGNRDDIYEALNQCLNGLIFFRNSEPALYRIDFPVIITDSFINFHKREPVNGHISITEPFELEVDYSYRQSNSHGGPVDTTEYFLIDVVGFDKLDSFLQDLENRDIKLLRDNLEWELDRQDRQNHQSNSGSESSCR